MHTSLKWRTEGQLNLQTEQFDFSEHKLTANHRAASCVGRTSHFPIDR